MGNITKEITYNIPDKWQTTETTLNKTSTQTYTGPETVIALVQDGIVVNAYNKDKEDHRPLALDFEAVEINCNENTLHCGILWGGFDAPDHFEVEIGPADRNNPTVADPTHPLEVFDIKSFTKGWNSETKTWDDLRFAEPEADDPNMEMVRASRNAILNTTDARISDDMPAAVKEEWQAYRQALRDLPADFDGVPEYLIVFPQAPDEINSHSEIDPISASDTGVIKITDQGDRADWQSQLPPGIASDD